MNFLTKRCVSAVMSLAIFAAAVPAVFGAEVSDNVYESVDGTTGVPLGGFGAGAVKFNAQNGSFAAMTMAPADQNDYKAVTNAHFQLYSNVGGSIQTSENLTAIQRDGRYDDDAVWPEHRVNFGAINGVEVRMTAFSPLDSVIYDNMSMPYAFYEMTLTNTNNAEASAAAALLWDTSAGGVKVVNGQGFTSNKWAVLAESEMGAVISAGNGNGFFANGECSNAVSGAMNRTAVKVTLGAKESKKIKFVLAWYDNSDPDGAYYLSKYDNAESIAKLGLQNFDTLKANADKLVNAMRGSNVPQWFVNQCLNSLVNISNNSMYKTDGRTAFAEGEWTCFGTMDQMWHARQIVGYLIPDFAWQELEYWARTQRKDGQIHHDFNYMTDTSVKYKLVDWDDTEHADYRKVDKWVDLNCGLIISVYELYRQTGNEEKLTWFWPYMKKAGDRIFKQVELYGDSAYPYTFKDSENSYDAGGDPNAFNTSMSAVAYKIMKILCEKYGETELGGKYQTAYDIVTQSYRAKYLTNNFPVGRISESYFAGQWLAMHLKLGQIWTAEETDYVLNCLDGYYHPLYKTLGYPNGTYDEWTPYILAHYGGLLLNTRRQNQYEALQKDSYNRQFKNRNYVFNHPLDILPAAATANYAANNISGDKQYISIPAIWRNYYDVIGYQRNAASKELWLEPRLLPEMNHTMINAAYVSPEGYGTISCTETASAGSKAYQNKEITFRPENTVYVGTLYLEDNFGDTVSVTIDGTPYEFERIGEGYTRELAIHYNADVTSEGIHIVTAGNPGAEPPDDPEKPDDIETPPVTAEMSAFSVIEAEKYSGFGGVSIAEEDGIKYITECDDQDYVKYDGVGFEDGAKAIRITVRSVKESHIELALGLVSGETVQEIPIPNTNGEWQEITCNLDTPISGTQNVVFRFRTNNNESGDLVDIDSFVFDYLYQLSNRGWSATASANGNAAVNAFDRDSATRWNSSYQTGKEWYQLDLGAVYDFNKIKLVSNKDYPRWYEIYVSVDGKNFGGKVASGQGAEGDTEITFIRQKARYIKILQTASAPSNYWSIYELHVYNMDEEFPDGNQTPPSPPPADETINEFTYAGVSDSHPDGTKFFDLTKYEAAGSKHARSNAGVSGKKFADDISAGVKAQFADNVDSSIISNTYTSAMVNYIGHSGEYDVKPAIVDAALPAGTYTLYYIGGNTNAVEIAFPQDAGQNVTALSNGNRKFSSDGKLVLHEAIVTVSKDYKGDVTFYNSGGWLPDLYAVKLVKTGGEGNADFAVDTVYKADMLAESVQERDKTWYLDDADRIGNYERIGKPFGELSGFEQEYTKSTATANMTKTIYIPKRGEYRLNLLQREYRGRGHNAVMTNGKVTKELNCIDNQVLIGRLGEPNSTWNLGVAYADTGVIEPGVYSLTFTGVSVQALFAVNMTTLSVAEEALSVMVEKNGETQITAVVTNGGRESVQVQLVIASYDSDQRMIGSVIVPAAKTVSAGTTENIVSGVPASGNYMIFVWDGFGSMKPLYTPISSADIQ